MYVELKLRPAFGLAVGRLDDALGSMFVLGN